MIGVLGMFMNGLSLPLWYRALERGFGSSMQCKRVVFSKVVADQVVYAPYSIIMYFAYSAMLEGTHNTSLSPSSSSSKYPTHGVSLSMDLPAIGQGITTRMEQKLVPTWIADCCFWPLVNFVNFRYIQLPFRPTAVGLAQVVWQTYLSFMSFKDSDEQNEHMAHD